MGGEGWELYSIINSKLIQLGGTIVLTYPIPGRYFETSATLTDR